MKEGMAQFNKSSGRSIERISNAKEKFLVLREEIDYVPILVNEYIESDHGYQNFVFFISPSLGETEKEIEAPHWRTITTKDSLTVLKNPYSSNLGADCFFEVNTKGVGYTKPKASDNKNIEDETYWSEKDPGNEHEYGGWKVYGLSSKIDYFLYKKQDIMKKSMFLHSQGLRTEIYWAIQKLQRIPYRGEMKTIRELKDVGVVPDHRLYHPHIAERVMKTNSRIEEIYKSDQRREGLFFRMFETYNQESRFKGLQVLDSSNKKDHGEFQRIFTERMGRNLAVLFNSGYMHLALHSSNVTLASEMVDIGPMMHTSQDEKNKLGWNTLYRGLNYGHIKDIRDVCYGLRYLRRSFGLLDKSRLDKEDYFHSLKNATSEYFNQERVTVSQERKRAFLWWVETISRKIFLENENLPSLEKNGRVLSKDWGIDE